MIRHREGLMWVSWALDQGGGPNYGQALIVSPPYGIHTMKPIERFLPRDHPAPVGTKSLNLRGALAAFSGNVAAASSPSAAAAAGLERARLAAGFFTASLQDKRADVDSTPT